MGGRPAGDQSCQHRQVLSLLSTDLVNNAASRAESSWKSLGVACASVTVAHRQRPVMNSSAPIRSFLLLHCEVSTRRRTRRRRNVFSVMIAVSLTQTPACTNSPNCAHLRRRSSVVEALRAWMAAHTTDQFFVPLGATPTRLSVEATPSTLQRAVGFITGASGDNQSIRLSTEDDRKRWRPIRAGARPELRNVRFASIARPAAAATHRVSRMNNLKCATCPGQQADSLLRKYGYTPKGAPAHQRTDVYACDEGHYTTANGAIVEFDDVTPA